MLAAMTSQMKLCAVPVPFPCDLNEPSSIMSGWIPPLPSLTFYTLAAAWLSDVLWHYHTVFVCSSLMPHHYSCVFLPHFWSCHFISQKSRHIHFIIMYFVVLFINFYHSLWIKLTINMCVLIKYIIYKVKSYPDF